MTFKLLLRNLRSPDGTVHEPSAVPLKPKCGARYPAGTIRASDAKPSCHECWRTLEAFF